MVIKRIMFIQVIINIIDQPFLINILIIKELRFIKLNIEVALFIKLNIEVALFIKLNIGVALFIKLNIEVMCFIKVIILLLSSFNSQVDIKQIILIIVK